MIKLTALFLVLLVTLFSAIFLFALSNKKYKNRFFLGLFFTSSFLMFLGNFLSFFEYWKAYQHFDFIFLGALLSFYPFYYLYLHSAFNFNFISTKWIYHFIPAITATVIMFFASSLTSWESYQNYTNYMLHNATLVSPQAKVLAFIYNGSRYFHLIQILAYNFLAIQFILKTKQNMSNLFSNLDKYQLRYFYTATISFIVLMSIPGFYVTLVGRSPFVENNTSLLYLSLAFTILYLILAIVGLKQLPIEKNLDKFQPSKIKKEEQTLIEKQLLAYFNDEKPWLQPHLNIWEVAKHVGSNRSYISHVINENMGCNFNQFVNNYRVNESKKLLKQTPEISIAEISELSGFGSVSSFIRIFKSFENFTPTEFKTKYS